MTGHFVLNQCLAKDSTVHWTNDVRLLKQDSQGRAMCCVSTSDELTRAVRICLPLTWRACWSLHLPRDGAQGQSYISYKTTALPNAANNAYLFSNHCCKWGAVANKYFSPGASSERSIHWVAVCYRALCSSVGKVRENVHIITMWSSARFFPVMKFWFDVYAFVFVFFLLVLSHTFIFIGLCSTASCVGHKAVHPLMVVLMLFSPRFIST